MAGTSPPENKIAVRFDEIAADYKAAAQKDGREIIRGEIGYRRLQECFGGMAADSIASSQIEAFRDRLGEDLSPATVNLHLKLLRAIFIRAVRAQTVSSNPVSRVRFCKENNKRLRWLSEEEENALFAALPDWLKPLIIVALNTGMRKGELLKLRWRDIDIATGTITIRDPKSGEDEHVLMNETTKGSLRTFWEARSKIVALKDRAPEAPSGFVFTAPRGGYIHDLKRYWYPVLKRAGLEDFHFHDLRHTFASRAAMSGVDLYTLQALMRHRSPLMTQRYAHLSAAHQREAIRRLDRWHEQHSTAAER